MASTHNPVLYNAAIQGFMGAAFKSAGPNAATYTTLATAAAAFATILDAAIATDATLTSAPNVTIVLATAAETANMFAKTGLLQRIVEGYIAQYTVTPPADNWAAAVVEIAATYAAGVAAPISVT